MDTAIMLLNESGRWLVAQLGRMSVELLILAGIVLAALYVLRVKSPALRHLFWGLLLAKPLVTLLVASPMSLYAVLWPPMPEALYAPSVMVQVEDSALAAPAPAISITQTVSSPPNTSPEERPGWRLMDRYGMVSAIWILVVSALGLRLLMGSAYVTFLRSTALKQGEGPLARLVAEASGPLSIRRRVHIATTRVAHGPVLAGIFRPVILLPETMAEALTPRQLKLVITHELAHAKRWDNLVLFVQRMAEMFFFFHPVVWFCGWMMRREAESACDDMVVSVCGDADGAGAAAYADSLTRVAEMKCGITHRLLVSTFAAAESNFHRRIQRILSGRRTRMTAWFGLATGAALILIGILGLPAASLSKGTDAENTRELVFTPMAEYLNETVRNAWQAEGIRSEQQLRERLQTEIISVAEKRFRAVGMPECEFVQQPDGAVRALLKEGINEDQINTLIRYSQTQGRLSFHRIADEELLLAALESLKKDETLGKPFLALLNIPKDGGGKVTIPMERSEEVWALYPKINKMPNLLPEGMKFATWIDHGAVSGGGIRELILMERQPALRNVQVESASASRNQEGQGGYDVAVALSPDDAARFTDIAQANIGRRIACVQDVVVWYAMPVTGKISGTAPLTIARCIPASNARQQAVILGSGLLPAEVSFVWKNVKIDRLSIAGSEKRADVAANASPEQTSGQTSSDASAPWRTVFEQVYSLKDGEILKRIAPPFIPERMDWYRSEMPHQATAMPQGPRYMAMMWNNGMKRMVQSFTCEPSLPIALREILNSLTNLPLEYWEMPQEVSNLEISGDWVARDGAEIETVLQALVRILHEELGYDLQLEKKDLEREVIVASGTYAFAPLPDVQGNESIHFFADVFDINRAGNMLSGTMIPDFLKSLEDQMEQRILNEVTSSEEIIKPIQFHPMQSLKDARYKALAGNDRGDWERLRGQLLDNVAKQTGLQFRIERRMVPVWVLTRNGGTPVASAAPSESISFTAQKVNVNEKTGTILATMKNGETALITPQGPPQAPEAARPTDDAGTDDIAQDTKRGQISGVVTSVATGQPIAGAYVGAGDFGDSGGSNHDRHRQEGLYANAKTDDQGRFTLDGLAFRDDHPVFVTHPDYVRHDERISLSAAQSSVSVQFQLEPAARINVTVADNAGAPVPGQYLFRLKDAGGIRRIPPGTDPHLSAFASTAWTPGPGEGRFSFTELPKGEYIVDVLRVALASQQPSDGSGRMFDDQATVYCGGTAPLTVATGQALEVPITPREYGTRLVCAMPSSDSCPKDVVRIFALGRSSELPYEAKVTIGGFEDPKLARIAEGALFFTFTVSNSFTVANLPPGEYSVFAGPILQFAGARVQLSAGQDTAIELPEKTGWLSFLGM